MLRKTIYFKNFITTAVIVLLSFVILGGTFSFFSYRSILTEKRASMVSAAVETKRYLETVAFDESNLSGTDVRLELSAIANVSGIGLALAGSNGVIVSCSDDIFTCAHIGKTAGAEVLTALRDNGVWSGPGTLGGVYESRRYIVATTVTTGSGGFGYLFASLDYSHMVEMWKHFVAIFIMLALFVLLLTFIVSLLTTRRQAESLTAMAKAAHALTHGDFRVRVGDPASARDDEIGELEQAFNVMAETLGRSEENRSELLANVSHELRTPMTVISGFADGLLDGTIPPESSEKYLTAISSETKRLSRLVRSILDAAREDRSEQPPAAAGFNLTEVVIQTLLGLSQKIDEKHMDCEPSLPEEPIWAQGDADSVTQVVFNLLDNAVKFARAGSVLRIALWKREQRVFVSVEDEGETIPEDEMPLIFDRFHKVDRSRGVNKDGAGLGLYIVKNILDHLHEDIFVESADGRTKFTFTLKIAPPKPERGAGRQP
ncbi:MAG: HAMP domain-containing histidine kinase [Oscillospiraceae bacterium]|jgi:signal transduction histidine kinase|nr:HAMP domain-containing histidine kinase [Oscillospiraceae bacterium]